MKTISVWLALIIAGQSFALDFKTARLVLWKKGESIGGDDFLAANEAVVDYLATLERPTGTALTAVIKYNCQVKYRVAQPSLQFYQTGTSQISGYVNLVTVYDLKDCVKL